MRDRLMEVKILVTVHLKILVEDQVPIEPMIISKGILQHKRLMLKYLMKNLKQISPHRL